MPLFRFGVATEPNDYYKDEQTDEIWIRNDEGQLVLVEDNSYESIEN